MTANQLSRRNAAKLLCLLAFTAIACHDPSAKTTMPPLGATAHSTGTIFRVWAPFVDAVSVEINDGTPASLKKEAGHTDDNAVWTADVPGAKEGLGFNGDVAIGPYSLLVFSQD